MKFWSYKNHTVTSYCRHIIKEQITTGELDIPIKAFCHRKKFRYALQWKKKRERETVLNYFCREKEEQRCLPTENK